MEKTEKRGVLFKLWQNETDPDRPVVLPGQPAIPVDIRSYAARLGSDPASQSDLTPSRDWSEMLAADDFEFWA